MYQLPQVCPTLFKHFFQPVLPYSVTGYVCFQSQTLGAKKKKGQNLVNHGKQI